MSSLNRTVILSLPSMFNLLVALAAIIAIAPVLRLIVVVALALVIAVKHTTAICK
jgi:hypothetical protein